VDLLKLDIEGAERDVLAELIESGAIANFASMVLEFHHHPLRNVARSVPLDDRGRRLGVQIATSENSPVLPPGSYQECTSMPVVDNPLGSNGWFDRRDRDAGPAPSTRTVHA
jgi:hypothetical protein